MLLKLKYPQTFVRTLHEIKNSKKYILHMGVSTVKWIALDPCLVFNESDSKLCINFEFYEE